MPGARCFRPACARRNTSFAGRGPTAAEHGRLQTYPSRFRPGGDGNTGRQHEAAETNRRATRIAAKLENASRALTSRGSFQKDGGSHAQSQRAAERLRFAFSQAFFSEG